MIDLNKLEEMAKAATQGPWKHDGYEYGERANYYQVVIEESGDYILGEYGMQEWNAAFIAAANPAVILELIETQRELVEALRDMTNGWKYIRSTHGDLYGVGWDRAQEKAESALKKATGE